MAIKFLNPRWLLLALPLIGAISGCCCEAFPLRGECDCPTDARRIYCGAGEEAVRRCPCGPDREFYGLKPTNWRAWPEGWRYGQYPCSAQSCEPLSVESANAVPAKVEPVDLNPFRNRGNAEELPLEKPPAELTPVKKDAAKAAAAENKPTTGESSVIPEMPQTPPEAAPTKPASAPVVPAAKSSDETVPPETPPVPLPGASSAPAETPHAKIDENKSSTATGKLPTLIAAKNTTPAASSTPTPPAPLVPKLTATSATVPATAWSGRPQASVTKPTSEESPLSQRVAEHLTRNLAD